MDLRATQAENEAAAEAGEIRPRFEEGENAAENLEKGKEKQMY